MRLVFLAFPGLMLLIMVGCADLATTEKNAQAAVIQNAPAIQLGTAIIDDAGKIIAIVDPNSAVAADAKIATVIIDAANGLVQQISTKGNKQAIPPPATIQAVGQ